MTESVSHLLTRSSHRTRSTAPDPAFLEGLSLATGRVHELCGPARHTLALLVGRSLQGPLIWIAPAWHPEALNGDGVQRFLEPGRLHLIRPHRNEDLLWCMEEALRSGTASLVVSDLPASPALTPVRRLHLAAEAGCSAAVRPLGVILTPEGGAPGVESRWALSPRHDEKTEVWRLDRLRARTEAPRHWHIAGGPAGISLSG